MKKQLTAVLLVLALLLTMAGCSAASAARKLDVAEDAVEAKLDAAEDKLENYLRETVPSATVAAPVQTQPESSQTLPAVTENHELLTSEQAQTIALDYLGLTADQVTRLHTEYEIDDGIPQFDVSFYQGDWEYEFEIHAENGKIISYDKDHKYD